VHNLFEIKNLDDASTKAIAIEAKSKKPRREDKRVIYKNEEPSKKQFRKG
jgi:hypothetical protein